MNEYKLEKMLKFVLNVLCSSQNTKQKQNKSKEQLTVMKSLSGLYNNSTQFMVH